MSAEELCIRGMSGEELCVRWEDFPANLARSFAELREGDELSDISLVCGHAQGQARLVGAHKLVLAAASPFFQAILRRGQHPHPLIYLTGVREADLAHILDFVYRGQVTIAQAELPSFLAAAAELQVKGLTDQHLGVAGTTPPPRPTTTPPPRPTTTSPPLPIIAPSPLPTPTPPISTEEQEGDMVMIGSAVMEQVMEEVRGEVREEQEGEEGGTSPGRAGSMTREELNRTLETMVRGTGEGKTSLCLTCGRVFRDRSSAMVHGEVHLNLAHPCTVCGRKFKTRNSLSNHYKSAHNQKRVYALSL